MAKETQKAFFGRELGASRQEAQDTRERRHGHLTDFDDFAV